MNLAIIVTLWVGLTGLCIQILRSSHKKLDFSFWNISRWKIPDRKTLKRIAIVSLPLLALALLTMPLVDVLTQQAGVAIGAPAITESHPQIQLAQTSPILLLLMALFVPIVEEWFTKLWILEALRKHGVAIAVVIAAAIFALVHLINPGTGILAVVTPFIAGLIFGVAYIRQGIQSACAVHLGYNGAIILIWLLIL